MCFSFIFNVHTFVFLSISLFSHPFFSIPPHSHLMTHLLEWCLHFAEDIWCQILGIWCMYIYSYFHILYKEKYQKSICERLAFPCYWMTSFHVFGFHFERVVYHICMRNFLWVLWWWRRHKLCMTIYFHYNYLYIYKSNQL